MADQIQLFADSAGAAHLGMGCIFGNRWAQGLWRHTTLFAGGRCPNIALLELLAIVIALEIWAPELKESAIKLRSDNQATVGWLTRKRSDIPVAMNLLRHLTRTCLFFQIFITAEYIPTKENRRSDLVSRNQLQLFFRENPAMSRIPEPLPPQLWPPRWNPMDISGGSSIFPGGGANS